MGTYPVQPRCDTRTDGETIIPNIQFTSEIGNNNIMSFLDREIIKSQKWIKFPQANSHR